MSFKLKVGVWFVDKCHSREMVDDLSFKCDFLLVKVEVSYSTFRSTQFFL